MRKFKKILSLILLFILVFVSNSISVTAAVSCDDGTATYDFQVAKGSKSTSYTRYSNDIGITTYGGSIYQQSVFVFTQTQTENSKVVTWSVAGDNGKLKRTNIAAIALDYEKNHPDWKVVGGINADQYVTGFGTDIGGKGQDYYYPQPYYPMICDGEGWFIISGMPSGAQNIAGFLQDGSVDPIVSGQAKISGGSLKISGIYLYVLDENNNRLGKYNVACINETPNLTQTSIWTTYCNSNQQFPDINVDGNLYVVENAERAYATNSIDYQYKGVNAQNAFFGKGSITQVCSEATIGYGDFAIDTNDDELKANLKVGSRVLIQYEIEGECSTVESAIGYHTIQRMDGADRTSTAAYNTRQYPRSIVGRTASGQIVLIAIDGLQASIGACGTNFKETNAILKNYGVVEAYQMDGGGSVTAIVEDGEGSFDVTNSPSDGSARSVLSALFVVERRKPNIELTVETMTEDTTTLKLDIDMHGGSYESINFIINRKTFVVDIDNLTVVLEKIRRAKEYDYQIDLVSSTTTSVYGVITLDYLAPSLADCKVDLYETYCDYNFEFNDPDKTIKESYLLIDGEKYYIIDNKVTITNMSSIPYLKYVYNIGGEDITVTIKFPQSPLARYLDDSYWYVNEYVNNIYK